MDTMAAAAAGPSSSPPHRPHRTRRSRHRTAASSSPIRLAFIALAAAASLVFAQDPSTTVAYSTSTTTPTSTTVSTASTDAGSGVLNGPSATSATSSPSSTAGSYPAASTSVPSIDLSGTAVPYILQRPASSHVAHKGRPRVETQFHGCSDDSLSYVAAESRLNISAVYVQYDPDTETLPGAMVQPGTAGTLRITGVGAVANESYGASNGYFSAIQVRSRFLTFDVWSNLTYLCDRLYPTGNDTIHELTSHASCTYGPGNVGFGVDVPLNASYNLGTIWTRVLLVDSSQPALTIACIDVPASPYDQQAWYWNLIFYLPIGLFAAYFVTVSLARAITAAATRARAFRNRAREGSAPSFLRDHLNPVIISALSGQGMVLSPALLRFATPGCWDILFQIQFVAALGMIAVRWPDFSYPFFKQAAWSTLVGNVTLVQAADDAFKLLSPFGTNASLPAGDIGTQMDNTSSPLYMNHSAPQTLLNLNSSYTGIPAFAQVSGLAPTDLFGTCVAIWLLVVAVFVAVAIVGWFVDTIALATTKIQQRREDGLDYQLASEEPKTPGMGSHHVFIEADGTVRDTGSRGGYHGFLASWPRGFNPSPHLHWAALHGNIVRAVAMFHLPITIFSVYQFSNAGEHTTQTVALSAVSFAIISVMLPAYIIWRIAVNPASKLYDDIDTLLALGPVYNTFSPGSQLYYCVTFAHSLVVGVVIGAGQASGSAQAIVLVVFEVLLALASSLWLPWGEGAMMGPASFMTSVLRVISAVLVLLISPLVDLSVQANSWITYVILLLQGIFFAGATLILLVKLIESAIRLIWRVPYDERVNARSGGIGGAIRKIRRRRDKILQLSNPKRNGRHKKAASSSGQSIMLANAAMPGRRPSSMGRVPSTPGSTVKGMVSSPTSGSIPLTRSRQASIAGYLDFANGPHSVSAKSPGSGARPTSPSANDFMSSSGPYSAYFHHDGEDEDAEIMAALPPTSPGPWGPAPLPPGESAAPAASSGFQRVGGGRATDSDPYGTASRGHRTGGSAGGSGDAGMSSTAAAAQFARANSRRDGGAGGGKRAGGIGGLFGRRRGGDDEDYIEEEDEDDPYGGTWGTSTLSTQHGPWNGIAKMQAALAGIRGRLTGNQVQRGEGTLGGLSEEGDTLPPSGGFQVIRDRAPRGGANHAAAAGPSSAPMLPARSDDATSLMDSTAMAAASSTSRPTSALDMYTAPAEQRAQPASSAAQGRRSRGSNTPPLLDLSHTPGQAQAGPSAQNESAAANDGENRAGRIRSSSYNSSTALGILGADLERALTMSSAQHDTAPSEERFWLPPNRVGGGGEGVMKGSGSAPVSEQEEKERKARRLEGLTAKIELMDPDEERR